MSDTADDTIFFNRAKPTTRTQARDPSQLLIGDLKDTQD